MGTFLNLIFVHRGIFYVLTASTVLVTASSVSKILSHIPSFEFTANRGYHCFLISLCLCCFHGFNPMRLPNPAWTYLCALMRISGYIIKIVCIANMPLGDATALYFTVPIYTGILARIFLKEPWGIVHAISTTIGITGIVLISKPSFIFGGEDEVKPLYPIILVGGAIIQAGGITIQRKLGKSISPMVFTFHQSMVLFVVSMTASAVSGAVNKSFSGAFVAPSCYEDRGLMTFAGSIAIIGQILYIKGINLENAAVATLLRNTDTILAYVVQVTYFKKKAEWLSLVGAILIAGSTAMIIIYKNYFLKKDEGVSEKIPTVHQEENELEDTAITFENPLNPETQTISKV